MPCSGVPPRRPRRSPGDCPWWSAATAPASLTDCCRPHPPSTSADRTSHPSPQHLGFAPAVRGRAARRPHQPEPRRPRARGHTRPPRTPSPRSLRRRHPRPPGRARPPRAEGPTLGNRRSHGWTGTPPHDAPPVHKPLPRGRRHHICVAMTSEARLVHAHAALGMQAPTIPHLASAVRAATPAEGPRHHPPPRGHQPGLSQPVSAARPAACIAGTGASTPVKIRSCSAAWCTSISSPETTVAPAAEAARASGVGQSA